MTTGYPRFPAISGDTIVFVAEDDLWKVDVSGGTASRITAGVSAASHPRISADGGLIAYSGAEEGPREVYVVPMEGGESRRLTFEGGTHSKVVGWDASGNVLFSSTISSAHMSDMRLHRVGAAGGEVERLPYGRASSLSHGPDGVVVLAREYFKDLAHWKRYRGGTAGQLWIDARGDGRFERLIELDGNLSDPHVIGERVYFLSDHEGHGNVYSCGFDGTGLRRHTDHEGFYARGLSGDGARLVYHCGGELYLLDPGDEHPTRLDIRIGVTRTQRARRFVDADAYLHSIHPSPDGSRLAISARGKAFVFGNWEGPVTQLGEPDGHRYRLVRWLFDQQRVVAVVGDTSTTESLVVMRADGSETGRLDGLDIGRPVELVVSPVADLVAIANHRNELLTVDLSDGTVTKVDGSGYGSVTDVAFSPDGRWLAYSCPETMSQEDSDGCTAIKIADLESGESAVVVERVLRDDSPVFDPDGRYLYFIGRREFNPVYDALHFDLGFPKGSRPYAVALRPDVPAPFVPEPKSLHDQGGESASPRASETERAEGTEGVRGTDSTEGTEGEGKTDDAKDESPAMVDFDGIQGRVVPVPVPDGVYTRVLATSGKILLVSYPVQGSLSATEASGSLDSVDLTTGKVDRMSEGVDQIWLSGDAKTLLYRAGDQFRVVKAGEKLPDTHDRDRESGWIDLSRVKVSVRPELEWPQMFREAWRLIRDHFWDADISGVDWDAVYDRYSPLVDRISTRGELSDLIWEMNGELGTSHAYEAAGDYRLGPHYGQGFLGATFTRDEDGLYRIERIHTGDVWDPAATSPLNRPGVDARPGDAVLAINGQPVGGGAENAATPAQRLVNLADQEVRVLLRRGEEPPHTVVVRALADELPLRYRDWVEHNRRAVHAATDGRVGYVHIPDMGPRGYAEFHRSYLNEYDRSGLVIDVRYNGGGHVSGLIVEKLARRRIGYDYSRWNAPVPHPVESPRGPMVALTNENAGSDGDIFSQAFKQMELGPLVGTRTWGGVVGYRERPGLSDNTFLSQPEFAFHFHDTKWGVENHGVDPDIVVEYPPHDYAAGRDPQLEKAIEVALAELEARPGSRPDPDPRPRLAPPALPPRP